MKRITLVMKGVFLIMLWVGTALAEDSRFIFSDLTVKDISTGLVWTRDGNLGKLEWNGASALLTKLNGNAYAGAKNWRLPAREELKVLITYAVSTGYVGEPEAQSPYNLLNEIGFRNVQLCEYLSSNPREVSTDFTWVISSYDGKERNENKEHDFCVWPVRVDE